jgi:hypothetical protein
MGKIFLPLVLLFFLPIRAISRLLLGKRSGMDPIGSDQKIEKKIRETLRFLFEQFHAKVLSNVKYRAFGNSEVFIEVGNVQLRIVRENRDHLLLVSLRHSVPEETGFLSMSRSRPVRTMRVL